MQNNRASIFMPFDALKGFKEMLIEQEKLVENKHTLDVDSIEDINKTLLSLNKNDYVEIIYYKKNQYVSIKDNINKIDKMNKTIILSNDLIKLEDIIKISYINE